MNTLSTLTEASFLVIAIVFFTLLFRVIGNAIEQTNWATEKKRRIKTRFAFGLVIWAAIVSTAALSGFSSDFSIFPLNAGPFLILPLLTIIILVSSPSTKEILTHISPKVLVTLQVFRVFVELVLWALFVQGVVPEQMTFEGRNLDVLSGIFGAVVGIWFIQSRRIVWIYNIAGLLLLINIVTVAILSMPTPWRLFTEGPANTMALGWPGIFLPTFLVPLAYGLHFLSIRRLLTTK